jgi:hypothetical protein
MGGLDATATADEDTDSPRPAALIRPNREVPINGRTALMYLESDGPIHLASLGMFGQILPDGRERPPTLEQWRSLLEAGGLAGPRDIAPTSPRYAERRGRFFYGRVAGVAQGSLWTAQLTDDAASDRFTIPSPGDAVSYAISTVDRNTLGTGQIQSAPMLARYEDTAYRAHGNYGIHYNLDLPLHNPNDTARNVAILFQTPMKDESLRGEGLRFLSPPLNDVFYRGALRLRYENNWGMERTRYVHVIQRRGQQGEPLLTLRLDPGEERHVEIDFLYPPDATPPQALTIQTLAPEVVPQPEPDDFYPSLGRDVGE